MSEQNKKFIPSPSQSRVLESSGKNILVSASAGTGKTTVMIQKIAGLIKEGKVNLKQLLVVTFTDMAAYEMKKRLVKELSSCGDKKILSQLAYIDTCDISTLHGFCSSLIRKYFVEADIDPAYAILSGAERDIAFAAAVDKVFTRRYAQNDADFTDAVEIFGWGRKDDNVKEIVGKLYNFITCKHDGEGWLQETLARYVVSDGENYYTRALNEQICREAESARALLEKAAERARVVGLDRDADFMSRLAGDITVSRNKSLKDNLRDLRQSRDSGKLPPLKKDEKESAQFADAHGFCSAAKSKAAEIIKSVNDKLPDLPYKELLRQMDASSKLCKTLFDITAEAAREYEKYKKQNALLDFNDLEHKALRVLSIDRVADEVSGQYKFIFVDEYQDINEIQEAIISRIKRKDNVFMVGDVKQSIYAFRQCAPDIFVDKIELFGRETALNQVEYLNRNYRSDKEILGFVNEVFSVIMTEEFGGVDYRAKSCLEGEKSLKGGMAAVTLDMINFSGGKKADAVVYDPALPPVPEFDRAAAEAKVILNEIRNIVGLVCDIDGVKRAVTYGDIVILCRDMQSYTQKMVSCLRAAGLPVNFTAAKDVFASAEIKALINLLRLADNRCQDLPLLGCMTGFAGEFTDDEAAEIFCHAEGDTLWAKLTAYAAERETDLAKKIRSFVSLVDKTAFLAQSLPVNRLLAYIMDETDYGLKVLGLPDGIMRMKNVNAFCDSLKGARHNRSVREFLRFADGADKAGADLAFKGGNDAVRVMTIHKSKGLEFPVVFLSGCGRTFRFKPDQIICDKKHGFGSKAYDLSDRTKYNTISGLFLENIAKTKMKEEEMRLLYVAMTRAKCHLVLTGCHEAGKEGDGSYFQWVDKALSDRQDGVFVKRVIDAADVAETSFSGGRRPFACDAVDVRQAERVKEKIYGEYKHVAATTLELKAVSSNLKPYQRPTEDESDFMPKTVDLAADGITADKKGTAYHKVLEKINFADKTIKNVEDTIERLVADGEIEADVAATLKAELVLKVISLPVFDGIQNKKVYRELPFMLKTRYGNLFDDKNVDENIFLQGVIDMLIIDGDKAVIVDYKFSRDENYLRGKYDKQLESYAEAVRQILKIKDVRKYIVGVAGGSLIEM